MPDRDTAEENLTGDEALLAEIRDRFDYCQDQWKDVRDEAKTDMLYVSGDPWSQSDRLRREQAGRPCLVMDEYSQYANQIINDIRQNERAVEVVPRGFGANDKIAELRGDQIREIEYKSNAQAAYVCGFENMLNRSYGGWKIVRRYVSDKSFDQEIRIMPIPNPDSSYPDPDCKEADYSDAKYWFLLDLVPRKEYKRRYPKAQITDFEGVHFSDAPAWIKEDQIQVAEYWRVETKRRRLLQVRVADDQPVIAVFEDELPDGETKQSLDAAGKLLDDREVEARSIVQYITNGVEILEKNPQPGKYIPIVWLTGKELYINDGSGPRRILMSLVRLARDPLMMVNYLATCEAEVIGQTPKTPWIGYVGQFHKPENWQKSISEPIAYLEAKASIEGVAGVLPLPTKPAYEPQIAALEAARESSRRAVQAALGLSALPTNAQRLNDKSGVALKQIDANEDRGSFHFIDKYEMAIEHNGRIINDLIPHVYHQEGREIGVRDRKKQHRSVKVNAPTTDADGQPVTYDLTSGEYEVTISTGPSYQSERELANSFVDTMVPELQQLPLDPPTKAKMLALLIKLKNVGPIGDEMVQLLDPQNEAGQAAQQLAQVQGQLQQYQQMVAELQTEVQNLTLEKKARVIDNQMRLVSQLIDKETSITVAEINTKAQNISERLKFVEDMWAKFQDHAHELGLQASDQAHEKDQAATAAQLAAAQQNSPQPGMNGPGAGA